MKRFAFLILVVFASARAPAQGTGVSPADSVFDAELMKLLVQQSQRLGTRTFPSLTISAQYSRHRPFDDQPVYQRGPYDLAEQIFRGSYRYHLPLNAEPSTENSHGPGALLAPVIPLRNVTVAPTPATWYVCGMIVRAPQVGETPGSGGGVSAANYLVRVAGIPVRYVNDTLWLLTLIQRAVADPVEGHVASARDNSVVYKKLVSFHGNESLTLQLPRSDPSDETVEEITLTHEPPQGFGLAQNIPDPVETRAMFAYALPTQSTVQITINKPDGTPVDTIAHGLAEAGVYRGVWEARGAAAGGYVCSMEAIPTTGGSTYLKQLTFNRVAQAPATAAFPTSPDSLTELFPVATIPLEQQRSERIFRLMVEGGAAYLDPRKTSSPFDNMFSHVAIGLGFSLTKTIEVGMLFGQDGFHVTRENVNPIIIPSSDDAVETRIVPWAGGYGRIYFSTGTARWFFHTSIAAASGGVVSTFGVGFAMTISSGLSLFLLPHRTDQWNVHPSTKWGVDYGIAFLF